MVMQHLIKLAGVECLTARWAYDEVIHLVIARVVERRLIEAMPLMPRGRIAPAVVPVEMPGKVSPIGPVDYHPALTLARHEAHGADLSPKAVEAGPAAGAFDQLRIDIEPALDEG